MKLETRSREAEVSTEVSCPPLIAKRFSEEEREIFLNRLTREDLVRLSNISEEGAIVLFKKVFRDKFQASLLGVMSGEKGFINYVLLKRGRNKRSLWEDNLDSFVW